MNSRKRVAISSAIAAISATLALAAAPAYAGKTLDALKQRGSLKCGVTNGVAGFSAPDSRGEYRGLDADFCRGLAAAMFGDPTKVRFVPTSSQNRFTMLQSGEIDVLARNATQTLQRDTALGLNMAGVNFYDGQGFLVRRSSNVTSARQLDGATICTQPGTTSELTLADYFRANTLRFTPVLIERPDAGPLIPGAGGLRKLRWAMPGRGKRGGARVIYYWRTAADVVYLVFAYAKNDQEDLTPEQARQLGRLIEGVLRDE